ncbi:MAG: type III-A CRISPR-associated RAMP protein Csm4 [Phascolarctobacterium sp.]|nr:type III-A CRISPR-associated RAMP protein Csm4 [Phascolarctobacterium sp.]
MKYYLFTLKFLTPVHFGDTGNGGNLERVSMTCSADTFFSALCSEAALVSKNCVETLVEKFAGRKICISSLFPFYQAEDEELELYLPKPLYRMNVEVADVKSFNDMKLAATKMKKLKNTTYVRASELVGLLDAVKNNEEYNYELPVFATKMNSERVNKRMDEPLPYFVGSYVFSRNAGLYFVLGLENEEDLDEVQELITQLGLSGIGGKRSSGYGKFELGEDYIELDAEFGIYDDDIALANMLENENAQLQMCIAPVKPNVEDVDVIKEGFYKLLRRSGFIASNNMEDNMKRESVYMLAEGSCFNKRVAGNLVEFTVQGINHKIYRNGLGMYVGVEL